MPATTTPPPPTVDLAAFHASLPADLQPMVPKTGIIPAYLAWATKHWSVTPAQMHLACILPVIAYEAHRNAFWARTAATFKLPPAQIRVAIVAPSAAGKSSALQAARAFHREYLAGRLDPWLNLQGSEPGLEDALAPLYDPQLDRTLVIGHHEEATALLRGAHRSHNASEDWYNRLFDGMAARERLEHTRTTHHAVSERLKAGGTAGADNPIVQAILLTTPTALQRTITAVHREGGLLSRIGLWVTGAGNAVPAPFDGSEEDDDAIIDRHQGPEYTSAAAAWGAWEATLAAPMADPGWRMIRFRPESKAAINLLSLEANDPNIAAEMTAVRIRGIGVAINIAALYALSQIIDRNAWASQRVWVEPDDAERAVALVRASWKVQETVYDETAAVTAPPTSATPTSRFVDRIEALLIEAGPAGLSRAEIWDRVRNWPGMHRAVVTETIATLEDMGAAFTETERRASGPGRPTTTVYAERYADAVRANKQRSN